MSVLNAALRALFDLLLFPFRGLPSIVGLTAVSLVTAIGMLLIFKRTSNQEKLAAVKRKIHAGLFEIRLFNDDLRAILRSQLEILRHNLTYLRLSAVPLIFILPPLVLVMAQLQAHYGYRGLAPGDSVLLEVELSEGWQGGATGARPQAQLELPAGLSCSLPPVWIPSQRELTWRLKAESEGSYEAVVRIGERSYTKSIEVSEALRRRSPVRVGGGFWDQLLWPGEPRLPGEGQVAEMRLDYPDAEVWFFGWRTHWIVVFFILSILFAFALRNRFKVTI